MDSKARLQRVKARRWVVAACGLWAVGCAPDHSEGAGSGSGSGGGGFFDPTRVSDLGPDDYHRLCELYEPTAYRFDADRVLRGACTVVAIKVEDALGPAIGNCEAYLADCLDPDPDEDEDDTDGEEEEDCDPNDIDPDVLADCDVTLSEIHTCRQAILDQLEAIATDLTCADDVEALPASPTACQPLAERCPVLFEE